MRNRIYQIFATIAISAAGFAFAAPSATAAPSAATNPTDTASATPAATTGGVPVEAQVARVITGSTPAVRIDRSTYLAGAVKAGVGADALAAVGPTATCWRWDAWRLGENVWGADLWKSHHRMNWCGDGAWIRTQAYTERWGETFWPGWNDKGLTQSGQQYGVGWNQYNSWTQRKFCYVEYFSCVQESNPYHNTTAFPNGGVRWN